MNRRSAKTLRAILAAVIIATMVGTAQVKAAALSVDEIYANAYTAPDNAMNIETQKSINDAREAIKEIPLDLDWAIGEFSKQVDYIQQPIFEKAYNAIVTAQNEPTQININAAKAAIDPDMPDFCRSSYSSAVDLVQLIAKDSANKYYNIVKTGWGPLEGFALQDSSTDVYILANEAGTCKAVIELVDVSSNTVIATSDVITIEAVE